MADLRQLTRLNTYNKRANELAEYYAPLIKADIQRGLARMEEKALERKRARKKGPGEKPELSQGATVAAKPLPDQVAIPGPGFVPSLIQPAQAQPDARANGYQPDREDLEALEEFPL